jgi:hypothetical protein
MATQSSQWIFRQSWHVIKKERNRTGKNILSSPIKNRFFSKKDCSCPTNVNAPGVVGGGESERSRRWQVRIFGGEEGLVRSASHHAAPTMSATNRKEDLEISVVPTVFIFGLSSLCVVLSLLCRYCDRFSHQSPTLQHGIRSEQTSQDCWRN